MCKMCSQFRDSVNISLLQAMGSRMIRFALENDPRAGLERVDARRSVRRFSQ